MLTPKSPEMRGGGDRAAKVAEEAGLFVTVAVKGVVGDTMGGGGSRRAVRWAADNLLAKAERFILVHVIPTITSIPTPGGVRVPVEEVEESVVEMYVRDVKREFEQVFVPFKKMCKNDAKVETLLLEHDDPAVALLKFAYKWGVNSMVMGSFTSNLFNRRAKGPEVPSTVLRYAPEACDVYIVCKDRIISKSMDPLMAGDPFSIPKVALGDFLRNETGGFNVIPLTTPTSPGESTETGTTRRSVSTKAISLESSSVKHKPLVRISTPSRVSPFRGRRGSEIPQQNHPTSPTVLEISSSIGGCSSDEQTNPSPQGKPESPLSVTKPVRPITPSGKAKKVDVRSEVERLKKELQNTVAKYKQACEELVTTQNKVQMLSSECVEEARRVNAAIEKEETIKKAAAQDRERHLKAMREVEAAKALLAKEFCERQIAEVNALKQYVEKKKVIDQLFSSDLRYRKYNKDEIQRATNMFSPSNVIGEGGYGKVYKCRIDHTPVAVKVLRLDSPEKKEEFLKEVEVLSQLRHPHVVLLLGGCPENGCLVYEYLENGSLEGYIYHRNNKPPLPWFIRFRIIYEVACGLAFLHNSKPEPIVHRDLKPGNILLDRNYVSKIGDVGLAKLVTDVIPDNVTTYRHSVLAGTLHYMDPEYQRTGTIRPKSDLYAFGIIILQLLTARHPGGLLLMVEDAVKKGTLTEMLDKSVTDWPLTEVEELTRIGLKCTEIRCRDRPSLEKEVIPVLKRLVGTANMKIRNERSNLRAPSHYFCPILREIMEDPHIAADGFTYERKAIIAWLEKHNTSPVTKQKLKTFDLTPNHTLRSAIRDWKSRVRFSNAMISKDG